MQRSLFPSTERYRISIRQVMSVLISAAHRRRSPPSLTSGSGKFAIHGQWIRTTDHKLITTSLGLIAFQEKPKGNARRIAKALQISMSSYLDSPRITSNIDIHPVYCTALRQWQDQSAVTEQSLRRCTQTSVASLAHWIPAHKRG
jgi:hypothetical protein